MNRHCQQKMVDSMGLSFHFHFQQVEMFLSLVSWLVLRKDSVLGLVVSNVFHSVIVSLGLCSSCEYSLPSRLVISAECVCLVSSNPFVKRSIGELILGLL